MRVLGCSVTHTSRSNTNPRGKGGQKLVGPPAQRSRVGSPGEARLTAGPQLFLPGNVQRTGQHTLDKKVKSEKNAKISDFTNFEDLGGKLGRKSHFFSVFYPRVNTLGNASAATYTRSRKLQKFQKTSGFSSVFRLHCRLCW